MKRAATMTKAWQEMKAVDIMKSPVVTLDDDVELREAARLLSDEHIGGAPVVDHAGRALGVVSLFDIVSSLAGVERGEGEPGGFYRQGKLNFVDMEEVEVGESPEPAGTTVAEIMAPGLIAVSSEATLGEAARLLWEKQIHRVFVRDAKGRLVGVISTMDILRTLAGGV